MLRQHFIVRQARIRSLPSYHSDGPLTFKGLEQARTEASRRLTEVFWNAIMNPPEPNDALKELHREFEVPIGDQRIISFYDDHFDEGVVI